MKQDRGQILGGSFGDIIIRQKSDSNLEIGELLISEEKNGTKNLLQIHEILYGSQISPINIERISGMQLEEKSESKFINDALRNYKLAKAKTLLKINNGKAESSKDLPEFFGKIRTVQNEDMAFLINKTKPLSFGKLRSGTKVLDTEITLDGEKVLSHHILISGTTGKGKSVLMKNLLWSVAKQEYGAMLVFDPHNEYYGNNKPGLKDFENKEKIIFYTTKNIPAGQRSLKLNIKTLRPHHFDFMDFTSPQKQTMYLFYRKHKQNWIKELLVSEEAVNNPEINELTLAVLRRKIKILLELDTFEKEINCRGIFDFSAGETVISDIVKSLENGRLVIVDTSSFSGNLELLVASMISTEIFTKYKNYNSEDKLKEKPVVNIVLEEAPRVIGKDVLEAGPNIFSTIAREGRKFNIGLTAITQLPSLIPKQVLANINTKIILGTEMNVERQAIIESAAHDLSTDGRAIASLDKGEAIISSNFARFAIPVKIPFFDDIITKQQKEKTKKAFPGIN